MTDGFGECPTKGVDGPAQGVSCDPAQANLFRGNELSMMAAYRRRIYRCSAGGVTTNSAGASVRSSVPRVVAASASSAVSRNRRIIVFLARSPGVQAGEVPARFTSQTCAACGVVDARSRESQARFVYISCGHVDHSDINAAINMKWRWNTPLLEVEGSHQRPYEALTGRDLTVSENPGPSGRKRC